MDSSVNYSPLIVVLLILSVVIAIILILILTTSQNPNPNYTSSYTILPSVVDQPIVYVFGSGSNLALQDSTGATTRVSDLNFALPTESREIYLTQLGVDASNSALKTPYSVGGSTKYLNYLISIYNQVNGENVAISIASLVNANTYDLVLLSDTTVIEQLAPTIEANLLSRGSTSVFYQVYNKNTQLIDGIYVVLSILLSDTNNSIAQLESYYYSNGFTNEDPSYTSEMIALNEVGDVIDEGSNFVFSNSKSNFVSRTFSTLYDEMSIIISKNVLVPIVISLRDGSLSFLPPSSPLSSPTPPTSVSRDIPLSSGFAAVAILPLTTGSVTMGSDVVSFSEMIPTNASLLSEVIQYNNFAEIAQQYDIPVTGTLSIWVSPSDEGRYIISISTKSERYILAIPNATTTVTFQNLNYLGSYGSDKLPSLFSNGSVKYLLTIIDSSNSVVGTSLATTLTLSGSDLRLTFDVGGGIIFDVSNINTISTSTSGFVLSGSGSFTYSSIVCTYDSVFLTFLGELRITGSGGNKYRIYVSPSS